MDELADKPCGAEILNLGRIFKRELREVSAQRGMNSTYFRIIMMLKHNPDGVIQSEIVENTYLKPSTISLTLKTLEQMGYLTRENSIDDNRKTIVKITKAGMEYDLKIRECFQIVEEEMIKDISSEEFQLFKEIIAKMRKNLQHERGEN